MGLWKRAMGTEPPRLPTNWSVEPAESEDQIRNDHLVPVQAKYTPLGSGMWSAVLMGGPHRPLGKTRRETSLVRAWVWAVGQAQDMANLGATRGFRGVLLGPADQQIHSALSVAAWNGEMGEPGYMAYGRSPEAEPALPGLIILRPTGHFAKLPCQGS